MATDVWRQIANAERALHQLAGEERYAGRLRAYAVKWSSLARPASGMPTQFQRGSFRNIDPSRVRLQRDHDDGKVVGTITRLIEDDVGLLVEAAFARTQLGAETAELVRTGALTDLSVGFIAKKAATEKRPGVGMVRVISEAELLEVSVVVHGADSEARIFEAASRRVEVETMNVMADVRNAERQLRQLKGEPEPRTEHVDWWRGKPLTPVELQTRQSADRLIRLYRALQRDPGLARMSAGALLDYVEAEAALR